VFYAQANPHKPSKTVARTVFELDKIFYLKFISLVNSLQFHHLTLAHNHHAFDAKAERNDGRAIATSAVPKKVLNACLFLSSDES